MHPRYEPIPIPEDAAELHDCQVKLRVARWWIGIATAGAVVALALAGFTSDVRPRSVGSVPEVREVPVHAASGRRTHLLAPKGRTACGLPVYAATTQPSETDCGNCRRTQG